MKFWCGCRDFCLLSLTSSWARPSSMLEANWNCWSMVYLFRRKEPDLIFLHFSEHQIGQDTVFQVKTICMMYTSMITEISTLEKRSSSVTLSEYYPKKKMVFSALKKLLAVAFLSLIYSPPSLHAVSVCKSQKILQASSFIFVHCPRLGSSLNLKKFSLQHPTM